MAQPHSYFCRVFTVHPTQLEFALWRLSLLHGLPALCISLRKRADDRQLLKTQSHTLKCSTNRHRHSSPPSLFLWHPLIYTVNTCPSLYRCRNYGNGITCKLRPWQRRGRFQCARQAGDKDRVVGEEGRTLFAFVWWKHLLSGIWCHARFSPPWTGPK